jgi:hypothetical protein
MRRLTLAVLFLLSLTIPTWAATYCWNPLAAGHAWTDSVWTVSTCNPALAGTAGPPTASDTAVFSSLDNSNVAISSAAVASSVSFTNTLGYTGTVTGSASLTISGSLTMSSGVVWNNTSPITFNATSTGQAITTAGVVFNNNVTFSGTGGGWTNQDNWLNGSGNTITLTAGTWNTGGQTITTGLVNISGSTTRTLTLTNSTVNLTGSGWSITSTTNLTRTLTSSVLNLTGAGAAFAGDNISTYATVNLTGGGTMSITGANSFVNLTVQGTSAKTDTISFPSAATNTISGTLTLAGGAQNERLFVHSSTAGNAATLSAANTPSLSNVDFNSITAAGVASPFTGTSIGNATGNTNITATLATNAYWVAGTGNFSDATDHWASSTGGSPGAPMPLPQDTANFDANSFSTTGQTVTLDGPRIGATTFSTATNSPTLNIENGPPQFIQVFGSLTLASGMSMIGTSTLAWSQQTGTDTLTTNGVAFSGTVQVQGPGGTLSLGSDLNTTWMVMNAGTFTANNHNVTINVNFSAPGSAARTLTMGSGTWLMTYPGTGSTIGFLWFVTPTNFTLTTNTATLKIQASSTPTSAREMTLGAGLTYFNLEWAAEGGTFPLQINNSNTFNDFRVDADTTARTLTLPASATVTATTVELSGESDALLGLVSTSGGTQATISVATGTVICDYCSIQDSAATGGATFYATQSTSVSNNTGWTFGDVPGTGGLSNTLLLGVGQ